MKKIALHLSRATWIALVFGMVFVAVVMSTARIILPMVDGWRDDVRRQISHALNAPVELGEISGTFYNFNPAVGIEKMVIYQPEAPDEPSLELFDMVLELDAVATLRTMQPVFRRIVVGGGDLQLTGSPGTLHLAGFPLTPEQLPEQPSGKQPNIRAFLDLLAQQRQIDVRGMNFSVLMPSGEKREIKVKRLIVSGPADARHLAAVVETADGERLELTTNITGRSYNWPDVEVNGYASIPEVNLQPWLPLLPEVLREDHGLQINQLRGGTELWFSYTPSGWDIRGDIHAEMVDIDFQQKIIPPLTSLNAGVTMRFGQKQPAQLWLEQFSFQFAGFAYPESNLYLSRQNDQESSVLIAADKVHLHPLAQIADSSNQLPELLDKVVSTLDPRGQIENLVIKAYPDRKPFDFEAVAELRDVGVDRWQGAPSGERINATVQMTANTGVIHLDSPGFTLGLDNVFEDIWVFDRAAGELYWRIVDDVYILRSDKLSLRGGEGDIETRLRLDIPFDGEKAIWMALEAGITDGDIAYTGKYLPVKKTLSEDLAEWLNSSVKSGDISQGAFIFNGPLSGPDIDNDLSWGLFFDVANTNIAYSPDWPELTQLDGLVMVDQDDVLVQADKAQIYNSWASDIRASVPDILSGQPLLLSVNAQVASNGADAARVLQETPIATAMDHAADDWEIRGNLGVDLNLKIPLGGDQGEDLQVHVGLDDNDLFMSGIELEAKQLSGEIFFSSAKGLYGSGLKGTFFDQTVSFDLSSTVAETMSTRVDLRGHMTVLSLSDWLKVDLSPYISGAFDYQVGIWVGDSGVQVDVNSDLIGLASTMPAPLNKAAKQKEAVHVRVDVNKGQPILITETLSRGISGITELNGQGVPERMGVNFGAGAAGLPEKGILVTGQLDSLKLEPWVGWWESRSDSTTATALPEVSAGAANTDASSKESQLDQLLVSNFRIKRLQWNDDLLANVRLGITHHDNAWDIGIDAAEVKGRAIIPDSGAPMQIDVARLTLPSSVLGSHEVPVAEDGTVLVEKSAGAEGVSDPLGAVNPASVPDMNVTVKKIELANQDFGTVAFQLRTVKNGLQVHNLKGRLGDADLDGSLDWIRMNNQHRTHLKTSVTSEKVENMLALWGYPEFLTGNRLTSTTELTWTGSPAAFSVRNAKGDVSLDIRNGRFLSVDTASGTGALRLFGVLNVDAITRRLRLDFSDLYRSGMAFDRVQGVLSFDDGDIAFKEPMTVKGPSSDFRLGGHLNATDQTLDMDLIVTLPVTQNIAVVSLLLGQPYIAGAAYLFDKLLGSRVEQFASLRYEIKGSFGEPDVKLDRLFSNKVQEKK